MNPHRFRHLSAWLGILAMWLVVVAPLVSQSLAARTLDEPVAAICSATAKASASSNVDVSGHHAADPLAACGYCTLAAAHATMPSAPPAAAPLVVSVALAAAPALSTRFIPLRAFPSGRPRAPPALS